MNELKRLFGRPVDRAVRLLNQKMNIVSLASRLPYYAVDGNFESVGVVIKDLERAIRVYKYIEEGGYDQD